MFYFQVITTGTYMYDPTLWLLPYHQQVQLRQKYYSPQVRPDQGSNPWPPDYEQYISSCPWDTVVLTTWPSGTSDKSWESLTHWFSSDISSLFFRVWSSKNLSEENCWREVLALITGVLPDYIVSRDFIGRLCCLIWLVDNGGHQCIMGDSGVQSVMVKTRQAIGGKWEKKKKLEERKI